MIFCVVMFSLICVGDCESDNNYNLHCIHYNYYITGYWVGFSINYELSLRCMYTGNGMLYASAQSLILLATRGVWLIIG